jgi:double-stranded uracil-DNA glycosylase
MTRIAAIPQMAVLMRAKPAEKDGRIDLLMRPVPAFDPNQEARIQLLFPTDVRIVPPTAVNWFISKDPAKRREFEQRYGQVHPQWADKFLDTIALAYALTRPNASPTSIDQIHLRSKSIVRRAAKNPIAALGRELNEGMEGATFAVWRSYEQKMFAPGLFCPDARTALYALVLVNIGEKGSLAACERCGAPYIKVRKKHTYCDTKCEQAARQADARSRRKDPSPSKYVLPDLVAPSLDILFCGTAAGEESAKRKAYYAGPGNRFWPTLLKVGLTPTEFKPGSYPKLLELRMGLTDLNKTDCGNDCDLSKDGFDRTRLKNLISQYHPQILAFTSKGAAEEFLGHPVDYGRQPEKEADTVLFVLPSPSGNARRYWQEEPWFNLARLRQDLAAGPKDT